LVTAPNEKKLSVEYLEDETDMLEGVDDLDGMLYPTSFLEYFSTIYNVLFNHS